MTFIHAHGFLGEINSYHARALRSLKFIVAPNPKVVDVGSHLGGWTYLARRAFGPGEYFAIDPQNLLRNSWRKQFLRFTKFLQYAISDFDGEAAFYESNRVDSSSLVPMPGADHVAVQVRRLDTLIDEGLISAPHVLKIDAEGSDFQVLESLGTYTAQLTVCVIEVSNLSLPGSAQLTRINEWMARNDFVLFGIWPAAYTKKRYVQSDYVLVRSTVLS